jgi:hypothetical protein
MKPARLLLSLACLLSVVLAVPVAEASAAPKPTWYRGRTSQGHEIRLATKGAPGHRRLAVYVLYGDAECERTGQSFGMGVEAPAWRDPLRDGVDVDEWWGEAAVRIDGRLGLRTGSGTASLAVAWFPDQRGVGGAEACRTGTFTWKVSRWLEGPGHGAVVPTGTQVRVGDATWSAAGARPSQPSEADGTGGPTHFTGSTDQGRLIRFDVVREPERHLENLYFRTDANCRPSSELFEEPFPMWVSASTVPIVGDEIHDGFWFVFLFAWIDGSVGPHEASGTVTTGWAQLDPDTEEAITCASGDRAWRASPVDGGTTATTSRAAAGRSVAGPTGSGWVASGPVPAGSG